MDPVAQKGFFSLLRWRADPTRDEARNIAVLLVDSEGRFGGMRSAPLSRVSQSLHEQGILDDVLLGLEQRLTSRRPIGLDQLVELQESSVDSIVLTPPRPVAVTDPEETAAALYRAYVAPKGGGPRAPTKGIVLDRVVAALRRQGVSARRGRYVEDFIFDVVVESQSELTAIEVLSFGVPRKDWAPVERDAGHFLFGIGQLRLPGRAVIQPPLNGNGGSQSHARIRRWLDAAGVPVLRPEDVIEPQEALFD